MMQVGDIMSTVEGVQYHGGKSLLLVECPMVLNTLHGTHDIPPHVSPYGTQISKDGIPHGTEHPMVLMISPTCIMISPTVLKIPPWYS